MNARLFRYFSAGAMLALSLGAAAPVRAAPAVGPVTTVVVKPSAMNGWVFYDDTNDVVNNALGTFVYGPATPINGKGSAQITISPSNPAQRTNLATYQFAGTKLNAITTMKFELYNPSGKDVTTGFLNFNVDWDGSDTWQRRLVFSSFPVAQNTWREVDALGSSMWWLSGGNWPAGLGGEVGTTQKSWSTIVAYNPGIARIRLNDGHLGLRVGSGGVGDNYTENYSSFTFGTTINFVTTTTLFDFEPEQQVVVVRPGAMGSWYFFNDTTNALDTTGSSFVVGPAAPMYGTGSAQVAALAGEKRTLANAQFGGTPLGAITALKYRTYNPSAGNGYGPNAAGYMYFNVDFTGSNTWQSSLIYLPGDNGGATPDTWKEFDTLNGGAALWRYSGANWPAGLGGDPGTTPKTWNAILAAYPTARILALYGGQLSIRVGEPYGAAYTENIDSVTVGTTAAGVTVFDFEPAGLSMTPATKFMGVGQSFTQDLILSGANNLYGYQYEVTYDASKVSAVGSFVNTLFDTTVNASVPPAWNAVCAAGVCKFAASKTLPAGPVNGSGPIGRIVFTALATGVVNVNYSGATLSDPDANPITVGTQGSTITIYGTATISGVVKLQGRTTPFQDGVVFLNDMSGTFGPKAGTFDGATGAYSIVVRAVAGGTTWRITADHSLYLSNQTGPGTDLVVMPGVNQTLATQTLRAGDANNSEVVDIADLSCVGGAFGGGPAPCGLTGNSDINSSGGVDIFDLVLVGGNYNKVSPQPWQ